MRLLIFIILCEVILLTVACSNQTGAQSELTQLAIANATTTAHSVDTQQAAANPTTAATTTATTQPTTAPSATPVATSIPSPTFTPSPILKPVQKDPLNLALAEGVEIPLVQVPAGEFLMGSGPEDTSAQKDEKPQHTVYLDEFLIGKTEVTVAQFRAFILIAHYDYRGVLPTGRDNYPIEVNPADATAFCRWASEWTGRKVMLPTEAQWEKAARGTDGRIYPWGNEAPDCQRANIKNCIGEMSQVGSYPTGASPYGALDMAGNMWEIVSDLYQADYYQGAPVSNPTGATSGSFQVMRGGSFADLENTRSADRFLYDYAMMGGDPFGPAGFRVAVAP
jgi:eukaryotic-like serine/threonine-protein kinase